VFKLSLFVQLFVIDNMAASIAMFVICSFLYTCSHTLIGAFSTTLRELSRGPGEHNEYSVNITISWPDFSQVKQ